MALSAILDDDRLLHDRSRHRGKTWPRARLHSPRQRAAESRSACALRAAPHKYETPKPARGDRGRNGRSSPTFRAQRPSQSRENGAVPRGFERTSHLRRRRRTPCARLHSVCVRDGLAGWGGRIRTSAFRNYCCGPGGTSRKFTGSDLRAGIGINGQMREFTRFAEKVLTPGRKRW
jgi:hypothetical protein